VIFPSPKDALVPLQFGAIELAKSSLSRSGLGVNSTDKKQSKCKSSAHRVKRRKP
jgi:hypothetical protein